MQRSNCARMQRATRIGAMAPPPARGACVLPQQQAPARLRPLAAAAAASTTTTTTTNQQQQQQQSWQQQQQSWQQQQQQLRELQALAREAVDIAVAAGPRGALRGVQAAQAVAALASEYVAAGRADPPQVALRRLFEALGVTFIKLGQFVASSPSLFPPEYVDEFQSCLDRAAPVPWRDIEAVLREDLGRPPREVFAYIDERPLASASIAQVHAAVLRGSGREVAVKVVKPGTAGVIAADLGALYLATRLAETLQPDLRRLSLGAVLAQLRASMAGEVDMLAEAGHLTAFGEFLDRRGLRGIATAPEVVRELTSRRVLVMERLRGVPLTDLDAVRAATGADPEQLLVNAINVWGASVLGADSFHADLHAGNIIALPDGRAGFLDFGLVGRISPATWRGLEALLAATAARDYEAAARALGAIGAVGGDMAAGGGGVDYAAFGADLRAFFERLDALQAGVVVASSASGGLVAGVEVDQAEAGRLAVELSRVAERHGVKFPEDFALLIKQTLYLDRFVTALAPGLRPLDDPRMTWRAAGGVGDGGFMM